MHAPRRTAAVAASLLGLTLTTTALPAAGHPTTSTPTGSPTATAAAGPSCTLQLNEVIRVDQRPVQLINAYLAQDCADAGTDSATWEIRHRVRDLVGDFHFPSSSTSTPSGWTITDSTPLGEYDVLPGGAYDRDTADGLTFIPQNTKQPSVRLRSWLTLGARRVGKHVVLHGLATRWSRSAEARVPWRQHKVRFWFRTCQLCQLHEMRQRKTNDAGRFSFRVYSPKVRRWSARTDDRPYTWGARNVGNPGDRIA